MKSQVSEENNGLRILKRKIPIAQIAIIHRMPGFDPLSPKMSVE
jgi:hypothetical protein